MKKIINWILNIIIVIIILIIAYLLFDYFNLKNTEKNNTQVAIDSFGTLVCTNNQIDEDISNTITTNSAVSSNDVIGYISFPSIGESSAILQGDLEDSQAQAMNRGISHDPRSSLPGEVGNTVLAGHRELFFKYLGQLNVGDSIVINIGGNTFVYEIESFEIINPEDSEKVFYNNAIDYLVMYTCYPIEAWKPYNERLVVKAKRIETTTVEDCDNIANIEIA